MFNWYNYRGDNMETEKEIEDIKKNKRVKSIIKITLTLILLILLFLNFKNIVSKIENIVVKSNNKSLKYNEYSKKENYEYVKINTDTTIKNEDDAKNALYTFIDSGFEEYYIMCDTNYKGCANFFNNLGSGTNSVIFKLNNFVHPFNTIKKIDVAEQRNGIGNSKFRLIRTNRYTKKMINNINIKVDKIYNTYYDSNKSIEENIKIFHDYILENTIYDSNKNEDSGNAYTLLYDKIGICGGYTDTMQLFLEKLGVKNYQISSKEHVWNLVNINNSWKHLDLTWDDYKIDSIYYGFFLIDNEELEKQTYEEHDYDKNIFIEAK